jgi:hypothetical protein
MNEHADMYPNRGCLVRGHLVSWQQLVCRNYQLSTTNMPRDTEFIYLLI